MKSLSTALEFGYSPFVVQRRNLFSLLQILGASLFIGLCAQIQVPLYFTPVPLTGQTFAVILIASTLSWQKAVLATLLYLIEGSVGVPVWAGGAFGVQCIFGPTGGYLLAYPLQAFLISYFMEKQKSMSFIKTITVLIASCCVQMGMSTLWLSGFVGSEHAMMMGFYPFVPGEILKSLIVTTYIKKNTRG